MREAACKIEVYHRDGRFELSYFPDLETAERTARESLGEDVREVRLLDESGRILRTFDEETS